MHFDDRARLSAGQPIAHHDSQVDTGLGEWFQRACKCARRFSTSRRHSVALLDSHCHRLSLRVFQVEIRCRSIDTQIRALVRSQHNVARPKFNYEEAARRGAGGRT